MSEALNYDAQTSNLQQAPIENDPKIGRFLSSNLETPSANTVHDIRPYRTPRHTSSGTFYFDRYSMTDGVVHNVVTGIPHIFRSSISVDSTTAWFTQPEGHNNITDNKLMGLGFRTRRIGPERIPLSQLSKQRQPIDFLYLAQNILQILDTADQHYTYNLTKATSLYIAESRGAMIEPALQIVAKKIGNRVIAHSDVVDPCCPEKVNFSDIKKLGNIALSEAEAISRSVWHILTSKNRADYVGTIDVTPECVLPAISAAGYLLNGEAGDLARFRQEATEAPMHITFMRRSYANEQDIFRTIYAQDPAVYIHLVRGGHMDIPATRKAVINRQRKIMEQLIANDDNPTNLDLEAVYEPAKRSRRLWIVH